MLTKKTKRKSSIRIETKFQKTTIFMHQQKMQMRTRREISISSYRQLLTLCQKRNILLITGIWMLKLCKREWNEHGPHGIAALNKNSEVFADVCWAFFSHKPCHKTTWVSPNGETENQLDQIAITRRWRLSL